jgi:hypothetical protein
MDSVDTPGGKRMEEELKEKRESRVMAPGQVEQFLAEAEHTRLLRWPFTRAAARASCSL